MMSSAEGFPPVASQDAKILILGSMPGEISLKAKQYYANPRNAFWRVMAELFRFDADAPYEQRLRSLVENRVALWDVVEKCYRPGSLDTSIEDDSIVVNDFVSFYSGHPGIDAIFFNGTKAEQAYRKYVVPGLPPPMRTHSLCRLPSTSPANARLTLSAKSEKWRVVYDSVRNT